MPDMTLKAIRFNAPTDQRPQPNATVLLVTDDIGAAAEWAWQLGKPVEVDLRGLQKRLPLEAAISTNGHEPESAPIERTAADSVDGTADRPARAGRRGRKRQEVTA